MNKNNPENLAQKIRAQYADKQYAELDELKALDRKVKKPAALFAYAFGSIAALVMGTGMSLIMTDLSGMLGLSNPMLVGVAVGVAGMLAALATHPIYRRILTRRREKYASQIMRLSDQVIQNKERGQVPVV